MFINKMKSLTSFLSDCKIEIKMNAISEMNKKSRNQYIKNESE